MELVTFETVHSDRSRKLVGSWHADRSRSKLRAYRRIPSFPALAHRVEGDPSNGIGLVLGSEASQLVIPCVRVS